MAPVIQKLRECPWANVTLVATAQHRQLADEMLNLFEIEADVDLNLMTAEQNLSELTARALVALDATFANLAPDIVMAQGDTTSVMAAAVACFHRKIPFLHVEAGLRSFDLSNPFPEEFNRIVASRLARLHFAPTSRARRNLLDEKVPDETIFVTGNTVIDALYSVAARQIELPVHIDEARRLILVTAHRRDNFGEPLRHICEAIRKIVEEHHDVEVLWPVHPNPNVIGLVHEYLDGIPRIHLVAPQPYGRFVSAMKRAYLILTDSGGVQEEAPALGRPVLVLRTQTERPEAIEAGVARLIGTELGAIIRHT